MSLEVVIHRASTEPEFRQLLLADPAEALSTYNLTEEEKAALSTIKSSLNEAGARRKVSAVAPDWT